MLKHLLSIVLLFSVSKMSAQTHSYLFTGNLDAQAAVGPTLTENLSCAATAGTYTTQSIVTSSGTCSGGAQQVFAFNSGGGLSYPNSSFITGTYTINIFFEFNALSAFQRIIDFSNSTNDDGMYTNGNNLYFASYGNVATPTLTANTYYLITLVRDDATKLMDVYINGNAVATGYNDAADLYKPTTGTTPIVFFRDDNGATTSCENMDGTVKYISLKASTSTALDVAATWTGICGIILPLTPLTDFSAQKNTNNVVLQWKTTNEINAKYFDIERSNDGQNFTAIDKVVASQGTAGNTYSYTDNAISTSKFVYYRLKMVDASGRFKYSPIVRVVNGKSDNISVFPNPAAELVTITGLSNKDVVRLLSIDGKVLLQKNAAGAQSLILNIEKYRSGSYIIQVQNDGNVLQQKFVKR
jgi:Secretion system C-terminal sorting domain/Concanavalin A-like lectin/glucanases superfamily